MPLRASITITRELVPEMPCGSHCSMTFCGTSR